MQKSKKKLLGLLGLALVALMTTIAYLLPSNGAYAETSDSVTETIRVTVYDRFPAIKIDDPATDYVTTSPELTVTFTYENSQYVDFKLSYEEEDEEGHIHVIEVPLPRFNPDPSELDPTFDFDSGTEQITVNLDDYNLGYGRYILTASADSPIGKPADDYIEFYRVPAALEQTGTAETTNDPIIDVDYDDGVARIEIMPVDKNGNPLFDEPIVVEIPEPYESGTETVVLPFTSYGIPSGDYDVIITAYSATTTEEGTEYTPIASPLVAFKVSYTQPAAPDVPNTGRFLGNLNLSTSDIVITSVIVFAGCTGAAFFLISRKKKNYRKNIRGRR